MNDKQNEEIEKLKKEIERLKKENEKLKNFDNSRWDFHWDGRGDYEESRRCFYGDFS